MAFGRHRKLRTGGLPRFLRGAAVMLMLSALAIPANAEREIPAISGVPHPLAMIEPTLLLRRDAIVAKREHLYSRTKVHNGQCKHVQVGSPVEARCSAELAKLSFDIEKHIRKTDEFNRDVEVGVGLVRAHLIRRLQLAQMGGRYELAAWWEATKEALASQAVTALKHLDLSSRPGNAALIRTVGHLDIALTALATGLRDCDYSDPDLQAHCGNIKSFQQLVHNTCTQLDQLQAYGSLSVSGDSLASSGIEACAGEQ